MWGLQRIFTRAVSSQSIKRRPSLVSTLPVVKGIQEGWRAPHGPITIAHVVPDKMHGGSWRLVRRRIQFHFQGSVPNLRCLSSNLAASYLPSQHGNL